MNVNIDFYAVVKASFRNYDNSLDGKPSVRACKNKPALDFNEVPILISLSIPKSMFMRPQLQAKITLPEQDVNKEISVEIQSDIAKAIEQAVGMSVTLNVEHPQT